MMISIRSSNLFLFFEKYLLPKPLVYNLKDAFLFKAVWNGTNLSGANFTGAYLKEADRFEL